MSVTAEEAATSVMTEVAACQQPALVSSSGHGPTCPPRAYHDYRMSAPALGY